MQNAACRHGPWVHSCTAGPLSCRLTPRVVRASALQYKYVVDGVWRFNPSSPVVRDEDGNLNNVLEVVDPCTSFDIPVDFDPPPSPPSR